MRYAIISDLHGNRQALTAVLTDIRGIGVDQLICLGDCVGYGPSPAEVLETAYANVHHFVLGNHDAVIAGRLTADCFNDQARRMIEWTDQALDAKSSEFFNSLPMVLRDHGFSCAHAEFATPGAFNYLLDSEATLASFGACREQALFIGHSHVPGLFVVGESGTPHWLEPLDFSLEEGKRYLVNVGSVGQPRDDDVRASYAVYDLAERNIFFRKVPFDIDGYRDDLRRCGLSEEASCFLHVDSALRARPLREMINFRPASGDEFVAGDHDVQDLQDSLRQLKSSNRRLLILSVLLSLMALGAMGVAVGRRGLADEFDGSLTIPAAVPRLPVASGHSGREILAMPELAADGSRQVAVASPLRNWAVFVEDAEQHQFFIEKEEDQVRFRLVSGNPEKSIRLVSSAIPMMRGQRFQVRATFFNLAVEQGFAEIFGEYTAADGTVRRLEGSTVHNLQELSRWSPRSAMCEVVQDGGTVRYVLEAQFQGEMLVRGCSLVLR